MDREKVIKGLERFKADFKPFCGNNADWKRVDDAITLLKELESERLEWIGAVVRLIAENELLKEKESMRVQYSAIGGLRYGACPKCDARVDNLVNPKACGFCGQELKWE